MFQQSQTLLRIELSNIIYSLHPPLSSSLCRMEGLLDQWLWKEEYWLPPGVTWKDIEIEGDRYPLPRDLFYTLPLALGFIVLRYVFER